MRCSRCFSALLLFVLLLLNTSCNIDIYSICVANLRHVVGLVVGGYSDLLGLNVGLTIAKAGKGNTKYGKMGHTDENET